MSSSSKGASCSVDGKVNSAQRNLLDGTVGPVDVDLSNLPLLGSRVRICGQQVLDV
ncbi:hypothetical protein SynPROSU1_01411 [Synechococcus sp. PROS-U-1]|nr:hypothetical protein SynPROSU1_01411 [Synechococcus sp. PROS-U-1]